LLKGLERVVQWYLNENYLQKPLYSQHAYTAGRSTETALSEVVNHIERAVNRKENALVVSLDCSGAFDCIKYSSAKNAMKDLGINISIINWYCKILGNRCVTAELQGVKGSRIPSKGTPQGGVLSPMIWNLIMNKLMLQFKGCAVKAIAYADDVILIVTGKDPTTLVSLMQQALDRVLAWGRKNGLSFNPDKTCVVIFSASTRKKNWVKLHMGPKTLSIRRK
jgi:hypothetical protein